VISVGHQYDAYLTTVTDGSDADFRSSDIKNRTGESFFFFRLPQRGTRVSDVVFVFNEIDLRTTSPSPPFASLSRGAKLSLRRHKKPVGNKRLKGQCEATNPGDAKLISVESVRFSLNKSQLRRLRYSEH